MRRQFHWLLVTGAVLLLAGSLAGAPASAQDLGIEGQMSTSAPSNQIETPNANDYLWIAGSSFKPRSTATQYSYASNGCIISTNGGGGLNDSFTVPFRLPSGSVIRGVRFYYYDAVAGSSRLSITSYDGLGGFIDHVFAESDGNGGYGNVYAGLTTPYTVDSSARGFVLNWYPDGGGSSLRLCGARVFYDAGSSAMNAPEDESLPVQPTTDETPGEPSSTLATDYYFLAGSSFGRIDSKIEYVYGDSGCMYSTSTYDPLTIDLDLPDGATLSGARFYFKDTDPTNDVNINLADYTGLGGVRTLASGTSSGSPGFSSVYLDIKAIYSPYVVNQYDHALNAVVTGAKSASRQLCGVRAFYTLPAARSDRPEEVSDQPAEVPTERPPTGDELTSPNAQSATFTASIQLPESADVNGVRLYYFANELPSGSAEMWDYDGSSANYLGSVEADMATGYGSTYRSLDAPYTVDYTGGTPALVATLVASPEYRFCGARIFYDEGSKSLYRFVAGQSFHPRDSKVAFNYRSPGCIQFIGDDIFLDGFE